MLTNMNQSERLHNQGNEQQSITRELELSMQLRAKCEQLLQEKGKTIIDSEELALHYYLPVLMPLGIIKSIKTKINPIDLVRHRSVKLKHNRVDSFIQIACPGVNVSKAKFIDVKVSPDYEEYARGKEWLRLYKDQNARFMGYKTPTGSSSWPYPIEVRPAYAGGLTTYHHQINQSSPIEHK